MLSLVMTACASIFKLNQLNSFPPLLAFVYLKTCRNFSKKFDLKSTKASRDVLRQPGF